ncbi:CPBP family intramembrane metalloprotease [Paenibacillus sp. 19GGS1-52]|uniref:CPBP family intramembrane glutamic endopeptidase n=1 Tax=Paenibacillus sp. 19GGS1-52 TaxID=2758563 RepID=UPI001EFB8477|nr:CPBP family intramembrane glutamic endopeptidase [Paenibacillus sp. 19GGS1-52]ULO07217.1 CPBP family intramembrane metalloprotease [Paenibacillus sp. 19GGS1-52]
MSKPRHKSSFSQKRPVLTVVIIELLLLLAVAAAGTYATLQELSYTAPVLISFIPIALVLIVYFTVKQKWSYFGFKSLGSIPAGNWIYYAPLILVLITISLKGFRTISVSEVLFFIFFTLLVGFVEESIYRGLILKTLLAKGVKPAVVTSTILFSVTHVLNAMSGQDTAQTILQVVYALLLGAVLALLMVKNDNIVPLILFHFAHNLIQFVGNDNSSAFIGYDLFILGVLAVQTVWLAMSFKKPYVSSHIDQAS